MGPIFKIPATIVFYVTGVCGFLISLGIVTDELGILGAIVAFFLGPLTLAVAPWYEALANSNWFPVMLIYGGALGGSILYGIGYAIDGD